jgi:SOS response regulatory protein OraA/RecX
VTKAVALLAVRERTREELSGALLSRGYEPAEVNAALERVKALGYLDDARVASARAGRLLSQGNSRAEVTRKLLVQGVEEALATATVQREAEASGQNDEAVARALLSARRLTGPRAARFLARRGFDEELIGRLVDLGDE